MRIALVCQNVIRGEGQGRTNFEVVLEAVRRGHHVTVVADRMDDELAGSPAVDFVQIAVRHLPVQLIRDLSFARRSARWLRSHRSSFDLVQVVGFVTWERADVAAVQYVHAAWMQSPVHTSKVRGGAYGLYQWIYSSLHARWEKRALQAARLVVPVSQKIRDELEAIGIPRAKTEVILNGADLNEFYPDAVSRSELGLPEGNVLALFVGDIRTPRKNLDTVLRALVHVPEVRLVVVGDTKNSPYPGMARDLNLTDRVDFLGFRRDVAEIMRACDMFVFPSRYEACTLVLMESLASGLPVITAATAGGAEVVTPECGFVLEDPEDDVLLASHIRELARNTDQRHDMRIAARRIVEDHSWDKKAGAYLDLFERYIEDVNNAVIAAD